MNKWTAYRAIVVGAVLIGLDLSETLASPYSIFAVLAGTGLLVDGVRRIIRLRRHGAGTSSGDRTPPPAGASSSS
ncbi:hypothetical protein AB0F25_13935 [Streptomyces wedmorensis]|uniref:hypothetical protein n=1 Tax=Streptomyces wedmorensis TaxID=43759 RepID=UPI003447EF4E